MSMSIAEQLNHYIATEAIHKGGKFSQDAKGLHFSGSPGLVALWSKIIDKVKQQLQLSVVTSNSPGGFTVCNVGDDDDVSRISPPVVADPELRLAMTQIAKQLAAFMRSQGNAQSAHASEVSEQAKKPESVVVDEDPGVRLSNALVKDRDRVNSGQGRKEWNEWRVVHPDRITMEQLTARLVNLSGYNLSGLTITGKTKYSSAGAEVKEGGSLEGAILNKTDLRGADISTIKDLTSAQLALAIIDNTTKLPSYVTLAQIQAAKAPKAAAPATPTKSWNDIVREREAGAAGKKIFVPAPINAGDLANLEGAVERKIAAGKDKDKGQKEAQEKVSTVEWQREIAKFTKGQGSGEKETGTDRAAR